MQNDIKKREDSNEKKFFKNEFTKKVADYIIGEQIGVGTFSKVTKGIHIITGEKVAIKILDKSKINDEIDIKHITREIEILKSISHENIAQLYESISTSHNFYLVMEYIDGGDLGEYIAKNISLSERMACHFFRQLISAIEYLNDMGITHRDLKPENILLDSSHNNIKVIDFGLSNYCANSELLKSACGSPCFASPEMLSGNSYQGVTTDLWSAGIVLYSMLVGTLPFDDQELNSLYEHIKIGTFYIPSSLSLECIGFLKQILQVNPNKRISIEEIKKHSWFNIENNIMYKGIDLTAETFPYNEKLIEYVIKKFYKGNVEINKNNFIKMLQYHACNQYTTTYYLAEKYLKKNNISLYEQSRNKKDKINNKHQKSPKYKISATKKNEKNEILNIDKSNKKEKLYLVLTKNINNNIGQENKTSINKDDNEKANYITKRNKVSKIPKKFNKKIIKENIRQYFITQNNKNILSHKISSVYQYLNNMKKPENISVDKKKPKSWSRKKNKINSKNLRKRNQKNIYEKFETNTNKLKSINYQTEINNKPSVDNKKGRKMKKKELSLFNLDKISNTNIKNSKIQSIQIEKPYKINKNISQKTRDNILNRTEKNNCLTLMNNISRCNNLKNGKSGNKQLKIREKIHKISFNKFHKKIFIKPNFNSINNTLNSSQNDYYLTTRNKNKIKYPEGNNSLILLKQKYLEKSEIKNKSIRKSHNKYKQLIDEYSTRSLSNNKENKKDYLSNVYFTESIKQINKNKPKYKYITLINSNHNKSIISNTKIMNNKIDINILKNSASSSLNNKTYSDIKTDRTNNYNKYKKQNRIINLDIINNKLTNNNNISKLFYNKLKINLNKEKSKDKIQNFSSYVNEDKINLIKKNKIQPTNKKISLSPFNKNNYNKYIDNNKVININFNNILKIKKQYSLNLAKSNDDSSKNTLYNNKDKIKIKNYFSSIPLSFDKKRERKNNKIITNNYYIINIIQGIIE